MDTPLLKPLLKWTGGKYNQPEVVSRVKALYEPFRDTHTWVEPFCGALGMTYRVNPESAVLSDINRDLINLHEFVFSSNETFDSEYTKLPYSELKGLISIPTAFYLVNKTCFNGLYRVNSNGEFNVPGNNKSPSNIDLPDLKEHQKPSWRFECGSYDEVIDKDERKQFLYIDPPYFKTYCQYNETRFGAMATIKMLGYLRFLNCPIVISNSADSTLLNIYDNLSIKYEVFQTNQNMNRSKMMESLAVINI